MKWQRQIILGVLSVVLNACVTSPDARLFKADDMAQGADFQKIQVRTDPFILTSYARLSAPGKPLHIYIEGDGYAWVTPSRASGDPTPRNPMLLSLAVKDPAANVVYLARPCQYTPMAQNPECTEFYWTDGRFSEPVIQSINEAISYFAKKAAATQVHLTGYSGGGALAILAAARWKDVLSLKTIAGNLDPAAVNRYHKASPLALSQSPLGVAGDLKQIPQIHFVGMKDQVVPGFAAQNFFEAADHSPCIQIIPVKDVSHEKGWVEHWPELSLVEPECPK